MNRPRARAASGMAALCAAVCTLVGGPAPRSAAAAPATQLPSLDEAEAPAETPAPPPPPPPPAAPEPPAQAQPAAPDDVAAADDPYLLADDPDQRDDVRAARDAAAPTEAAPAAPARRGWTVDERGGVEGWTVPPEGPTDGWSPERPTPSPDDGWSIPPGGDADAERAPPSSAAIARDGLPPAGAARRTRRLRPPASDGTPRWWAAEIKFGPYLPDVDQGIAGIGPYAQVFGRTNDVGVATGAPDNHLMFGFGFEWQFIYLGGPFALGLQGATMRDRANAILETPDPETGNTRSGADETSFHVFPLALTLGYRFEYLADRFRWVPLAPYARAGVGYGIWWSREGNGKISRDSSGAAGRGGSWGWVASFGGMLRLDFIEPSLARTFDQASGINHTYLFGEYQLARLDGFGSGAVSVGDDTWFVGFGIEF